MSKKRVNFVKSGMGIDEGTVAKWHKKVGERVHSGEILVDIETAKALQEIEAASSGVLVEISHAEGSVVPVNATLGLIEDDG